MNKKGLELAISTVVLFILGILILIGLVYFVTGGFEMFNKASKPLIDSTQGSAVVQACQIACDVQDFYTYCCKNFEIDEVMLRCDDSRINVGLNCGISCAEVTCESVG